MTTFRQSMIGHALIPETGSLNWVSASGIANLKVHELVIEDPDGPGDQMWFGQYQVPSNYVGGTTAPKIIAMWGSAQTGASRNVYFRVKYTSITTGGSYHAAVEETIGPTQFTDSTSAHILQEASFTVGTPANISAEDELRWEFGRVEHANDDAGHEIQFPDLLFEFDDV